MKALVTALTPSRALSATEDSESFSGHLNASIGIADDGWLRCGIRCRQDLETMQ